MDLTASPGGASDLEEVQARFEHWRQTRVKRRPIPSSLWAAASSLYPTYSLHRISKALRLNHTQLKHRVQGPPPDPGEPAGEAFIELGFTDPLPDIRWDVEMWRPDGSCMTVQGADRRDLIELARLFLVRP